MKKAMVCIAIILNITFASPASALFGSECKKPKSEYKALIASFPKLLAKANIERSNSLAYWEEQVRRDNLYPCPKIVYDKKLNPYGLKISDCEVRQLRGRASLEILRYRPLPTIESVNKDGMKLANRIIVNNPKCFSSLEVAKAQEALFK